MARQGLAIAGHAGPATNGEAMNAAHALSALSALGQSTRLEIYRILISHEPNGLAAGAIADAVGCPQNTLSAHLSILARSGLVEGVRNGRFIIYHANVEVMGALIQFLVNDCCDGHPELCSQLNPLAKSCCAPAQKRKRKK